MARRKKKNLSSQLKKHQKNMKKQNDLKDRIDNEDRKVLEALANAPSTEGVKTSVVDTQAAPDVADQLAAAAVENKTEQKEGLEEAGAVQATVLEGEKLNQWQAQSDAFSDTEAAVEAGATAPHPEPTVGDEIEDKTQGVETSVVDQEAAPNVADELAPEVPETKAEEKEGLETAESAEDTILEGEKLNQWQAEYNAFSETEAAVEDGATKPHPEPTVGDEAKTSPVPKYTLVGDRVKEKAAHEEEATKSHPASEGVTTSVIDQQAAPDVADMLAPEVPETKAEEKEGLEIAESVEDTILEGEKLNQWQAEYNAFSETEAAVEDGATKPHPEPTVGDEAKTSPVPKYTLVGDRIKEKAALEEEATKSQPASGGVTTSVVDQQAAPDVADMLAPEVPETKTEEKEGLEIAESAEDTILEGEKLNQWQAEYNAFSETEAAVEDGATKPHPAPTVGDEVKTSPVPKHTLVGDWVKYHAALEDVKAPNYEKFSDESLNDFKERVLTSEIERLTGKLSELTGKQINVVEDQIAPSYDAQLRSEVIPTKKEAEEGLEDASATVSEVLEGDTLDQWQAQSDVFSETNAAVDAGATHPSPELTAGELDDLGLTEASPEDISKVVYDDLVSGEKVRKRPENGKLEAKNHPIEKELPIYLL